jgi:predicted ArsR family transcriptional regulator
VKVAGPQGRVLEALRKRGGGATAEELSRELGGGAVAMRVHLRNLLAAGLLRHEEERREVGRPVRRFHLTAEADSTFPKQYQLFAVALADAVAERLGPEALEAVLDDWLEKLEPYLRERLPEDEDERVEALARHQSTFGFMASVKGGKGEKLLLERNCPIAAVAVRFPVICEREAELFERVTGRKVTLRCCQAKGDSVCEFLLAGQRKRGS